MALISGAVSVLRAFSIARKSTWSAWYCSPSKVSGTCFSSASKRRTNALFSGESYVKL